MTASPAEVTGPLQLPGTNQGRINTVTATQRRIASAKLPFFDEEARQECTGAGGNKHIVSRELD
jgi:hypothetical protein